MRRIFVLGAAVMLSAIAAPALAQSSADPVKYPVFLYVDTVNGTAPAGRSPGRSGCTQTNYFARGERPVFRVWGSEAATGNILSTENVKYAVRQDPGPAEHEAELGRARDGPEQGVLLGQPRGSSPRPTRSARWRLRSSSRPRRTRSAATTTSCRSSPTWLRGRRSRRPWRVKGQP